MATAVYRFRSRMDLDITRLQSVVGTLPVSLTAYTGGKVVDLTTDTTQSIDLIAAMVYDGYEFLSTNPVGPPSDDFLPPSGGSASITTLDITIPAKTDEMFGTVTGLSGTPVKVLVGMIWELGVPVQTGLRYLLQPYEFIANGFNWVLRIIDDEHWPGPGSITVRVQYVWS